MENIKSIEYLSNNERDVMVAACEAAGRTSNCCPWDIIKVAESKLQELRKTARLQITEEYKKPEEVPTITRSQIFERIDHFSHTANGEVYLKIPLDYEPSRSEWVFRTTHKELKDLALYLSIARIKDNGSHNPN